MNSLCHCASAILAVGESLTAAVSFFINCSFYFKFAHAVYSTGLSLASAPRTTKLRRLPLGTNGRLPADLALPA